MGFARAAPPAVAWLGGVELATGDAPSPQLEQFRIHAATPSLCSPASQMRSPGGAAVFASLSARAPLLRDALQPQAAQSIGTLPLLAFSSGTAGAGLGAVLAHAAPRAYHGRFRAFEGPRGTLIALQADELPLEHALVGNAEELQAEQALDVGDLVLRPLQGRLEALRQRAQELFTNEHLNHPKILLSGATSAVVSRTLMAPLERVKMEQLLRQQAGSVLGCALRVYKMEGVEGFWRGNLINLLRTAPFKAINFFCFDLYSKLLDSYSSDPALRSQHRFAAGAAAGTTATLLCFPLDVLRTRLMAPGGGHYGGIVRTLTGIVRHEGVGALYTGCFPALLAMAPAGAMFYGAFDVLKHSYLRDAAAAQLALQPPGAAAATVKGPPPELPVLHTLVYGAAAGACAELLVYPLEVVRRRMQLQQLAAAAVAGASSASLLTRGAVTPSQMFGRLALVFAGIAKEQGLQGFYAGLLPNMLQVLPSSALSFYAYETAKRLLQVQE